MSEVAARFALVVRRSASSAWKILFPTTSSASLPVWSFHLLKSSTSSPAVIPATLRAILSSRSNSLSSDLTDLASDFFSIVLVQFPSSSCLKPSASLARAKEADGFKQDEEGNWTKTIEKKSDAKSVKSDDKLLERLDKMALSVAGITAGDEVELFNKWKDQTNREADDVVGNKIFQAELADLRTTKANLAATSDIKGEHGESGVKNTPDYWIAKATKDANGQLLLPEETPKELYSKIVEKLAENEPSNSEKLKFYNSK